MSGVETHLVEASYPKNAHYSASTSGTVPLLATQVATTLTLASSSNPTYTGLQITLTATLSPSSLGTFATDGETITFYNGATSIGTGTLSAGVATLKIASLPVGPDTLTAVYASDGNFAATTSNSLTQTVNPTPGFVVTVTTDTTSGVASNCTGCGLLELQPARRTGRSNRSRYWKHHLRSHRLRQCSDNFAGQLGRTACSVTHNYHRSNHGQRRNPDESGHRERRRTGLHVNPGAAALSGLTITGGAAYEGAGILNSGALIVSNSTISGNSANGNVPHSASGGGIENLGT